MAQGIPGTTERVDTSRDSEGKVTSETRYDFVKPFDRLRRGGAILKYWPETNEGAIRDPQAHFDEQKATAKLLHIKEPTAEGKR